MMQLRVFNDTKKLWLDKYNKSCIIKTNNLIKSLISLAKLSFSLTILPARAERDDGNVSDNSDNKGEFGFKIILPLVFILAWSTMFASQGLIRWEVPGICGFLFFVTLVCFWIVDINKITKQTN